MRAIAPLVGAALFAAGCAPIDPERAAFDAETSRMLAALPASEYFATTSIASGLASSCRFVQMRRGVPADGVIAEVLAREVAQVEPGSTVLITFSNEEIEQRFIDKYPPAETIADRACEIAKSEMREGTLIGRQLI